MQEGRDMSYKREKVGFLYGRCSMSRPCMGSWLEDDEFIDEVWKLLCSDAKITDAEIYLITKSILAERSLNKSLYPDFKFQSARRGVNQLAKVLGIME